MPLVSPISGGNPDSGFFSNDVTFNVPQGTPILSPLSGEVDVTSDKTITITSPEGTKAVFKKVGTPAPGIYDGSKINAGSSVGYTGSEKLEFTAYNKGGSKLKYNDFMKLDPVSLALGAGTALATTTTSDKDKGSTGIDLGINPDRQRRSLKDSSLFKLATNIGLAPFHLVQNALNIGKQNESVDTKNNLLNEEIERIKKLMK
jgi:hypothetical protein